MADRFAEVAGYRFADPGLLATALAYRGSKAAGRGGNNETLEFLGDRVLGLVIAESLYRRNPQSTEGELARRLNYLVRRKTCAQVAANLGLEDFSADRRSPPLTERGRANLCEAVIAAVYLDGGLEAARRFIERHWSGHLQRADVARRDAKTTLQEWALARGEATPEYRQVERTGPDHAPRFIIEVSLPGHGAVRGQGGSKQEAEQAAAAAFIKANGIAWK